MRAGDHAGLTERAFVHSRLLRRHAPAPELIRLHRADPAAHALVGARPFDVRECVRASPEWRKSAGAVVDVIDVDHVHSAYAAPIPRKEAIAGPYR
jgi:hypothetical protein